MSSKRVLKVFISSTREDLLEHRRAVKDALLEHGDAPVDMDDFGAEGAAPLDVCLEKVSTSDLFVGIYAWRYGFCPEGSATSITEHEFDEAWKRSWTCLCFLVDERHPWPPERREGSPGAERLTAFKARLMKELVVRRFTTPASLAEGVIHSLQEWESDRRLPEDVRLGLLDRVERKYVEGVLAVEAPAGSRLEPRRVERRPDGLEPVPVPAGRSVLDLFEERERRLLILGEPGAGKTIALLQLLEGLLARARADPEEPVPLVFKLASWGAAQELPAWLAAELGSHYGIQVDARRRWKWITGRGVLPLLDGLDEVEPEQRPACVAAVNAFLAEHGLAPGLAVSCRTRAYDELPDPLRLEAAIELEPLTSEQVDDALATPDLEGVRAALAGDAELEEMARSPLWLGLMARAYAGATLEALAAGPAGERRRRLLEDYERRVLKDSAKDPRYPPERTRSLLGWLARGMKEHGLKQFQIERLQPSWLSTGLERWLYAAASRGAGGLLVVLPLAFAWSEALPPTLVLTSGLLAGIAVGTLDTLRLRPKAMGAAASGWGRNALGALFAGTAAALAFGLAGAVWRVLDPDWQPDDVSNGCLLSLVFMLLFGLVFGLRGDRRDAASDTRVAEDLEWKGWSWQRARVGAVFAVLAALGWWGLKALQPRSFVPPFWLITLLVFAAFGTLCGGFLGGTGARDIKRKDEPNHGTWLGLRNAGRVALYVALCAAVSLGLLILPIELAKMASEAEDEYTKGNLLLPLILGPVLGLWAGLWYSGLDVLQHFALRLVLKLRGAVPTDWIRFLDHATDRSLLHRTGASYEFRHGALLEHFAAPPPPERQSSQAASVTKKRK